MEALRMEALGQSHQPSGRRWSREFPLPTPFLPFGERFTPSPMPLPWTWTGCPARWQRVLFR
eukprot:1143117-Pyramimonas_sp.AAC.1